MQLTVEQVFESWTNRLRESTKNKYQTNIQEFFDMLFGKNISEIDKEDINSILPIVVEEKYIGVLQSKNIKNDTIKYKLKNVSQFMDKLRVNRVYPEINYSAIIDEAVSHRGLRSDGIKTKKMSLEDMVEFQEWLVNERYTSKRYSYKGIKSAVLVDTMYITGSRISAVFNIKWTDIRQENYSTGKERQGVWTITTVDKGDKVSKYPITDSFYSKMRDVLYDGNDDDYVFKDVSQRNFSNDIKQFAEEMGIEDSFTPHSLRSLAITQVYYNTGNDIHKAKEFANHESIETTIGYIQDTDNPLETGSYLLSSERITIDDIQYMSKEDLLEIISERQDMINYIYRNRK